MVCRQVPEAQAAPKPRRIDVQMGAGEKKQLAGAGGADEAAGEKKTAGNV